MHVSTASGARPRVAIGLPVYNGAAMLPAALDSLLVQTYGEFELIVSDNASTDATEEVCRDYAARDPRIRYVRQEQNCGSAGNFNRVFQLSSSEYFKWAAADDVCHPNFLTKCVEALDAQRDVAWCHTMSRHIDEEGALLQSEESPPISYLRPHGDPPLPTRGAARPSDRFQGVILGRGGCLDSYGLIRSAVLRRTELLMPYFGSEKVLMAELALHGRYVEIPEVLFFARIHPQAAGSLKDARQQRRFINPLARGRWQFARLRLLAGYTSAVRRAALPPSERMRCYGVIARYVMQVNKWKSVVAKTLGGEGLAGEYPTLPVQPKQNDSDSPCRVETAAR
ncbi:MAG: glycosyltransferase [Planctomycetes bacterium]|nr:glycosyltransferase [Planctomycetota bacterium]